MTPTKLLTRTGEYVVTVTVPPFTPPAEVIAWGSRLFVRRENGEYREGIAWVVPGARRSVFLDPADTEPSGSQPGGTV
jgi:hypothetical protein